MAALVVQKRVADVLTVLAVMEDVLGAVRGAAPTVTAFV